jgi:uncharacterized protein (DUF934 family)
MPDVVIRNRRVEADTWKYLGVASADDLAQPYPEGPVLVPLAVWKANRAELALRKQPLGVWLKPEDDPQELAADLDAIALVAVHFPKFADGRGYSTAFLVRQRLGYRGELRAFGDVGRDQLYYLARVGFDSFRLADHRDAAGALASFNDFTVRYQGSVDQPLPLFRRREVTLQ